MRATRLALALGLCFLLHAGISVDAAASPRTASRASTDKNHAVVLRARLQAASERLRTDQEDARALKAMAAAVADPEFDLLTADERRTALALLAWGTYRSGKVDRARDLYARATTLEDGDPDSWYQLALLEMSERRFESAARALIALAERWPEVLPRLDEDYIHAIRMGLDAGAPERVALLQALFDANWTSPSLSSDGAWYDLAVARLEQGKPEAAIAPLRRVAMPELLVWMRSDRRFDALVDRQSWTFNVLQAARTRAEALREQAQLRPDDLDVRVQLTYALLTLGEHEQMIALADEIDRTVSAATDRPAFADMDLLRWVYTSRAIAHRRLGRPDAALADLERALEVGEETGDSVSQLLNLGEFQCRLGHRAAALATVEKVGDMTEYGKMVLNSVRLCAALLGDDRRGRAAAMAYLREHSQDAPLVYLEALLRSGELDPAADALRQALAMPDKRGEALEWLQDYLQAEPLPGDVAWLERRRQLLARADVRAAIDGVGRIEHYPIYLVHSL
jgi:tetratricopeptide (TPR) repeat protein